MNLKRALIALESSSWLGVVWVGCSSHTVGRYADASMLNSSLPSVVLAKMNMSLHISTGSRRSIRFGWGHSSTGASGLLKVVQVEESNSGIWKVGSVGGNEEKTCCLFLECSRRSAFQAFMVGYRAEMNNGRWYRRPNYWIYEISITYYYHNFDCGWGEDVLADSQQETPSSVRARQILWSILIYWNIPDRKCLLFPNLICLFSGNAGWMPTFDTRMSYNVNLNHSGIS